MAERLFKEEKIKKEKNWQLKIVSIFIMSGAEKRIAKKKDFDLIFKKGKSIKQGFLLLKFILNHLPYNRFAIVISKKVSKSAVKRNKIRRVLKELIKKQSVDLEKNIDGVLIVLPGFIYDKKEMGDVVEIFKKVK